MDPEHADQAQATGPLPPGPDPRLPRWAEDKASGAEEDLGLLRVATAGLSTFVYLALMDPSQSIAWLASTVIGLAIPYAVYVWLVKPYKRHPALREGQVLSAIDATLVAGWVLATGGFESPFYVLWYPAVAAVAFRFDLKHVMAHSLGYAGLYLAVLGATGDLFGHGAALTLRLAAIPMVGVIGGLFSQAYFEQVEARYQARDRLQRERIGTMERTHRAVRDQEERWRSILTNAPAHIMVVARDGRIEYANRDWRGLSRDQLEGANVREHVPKPFRGELEDALAKAFQAEATTSFELMAPGREGEPRWFSARVGPITWGGRTTGAAISTVDVTERKEAEEETAAYARDLAERASELERSNEELTHYAELAAHDLQEPLRDITHYAQMLERHYGDELDEDAQAFLGFTVDGAKRMHRLLSELLHYSQLRSSVLDLRPTDLGKVLERVLDGLAPVVEERGAVVETGTLPVVLADPGRLSDAVRHVVLNGILYNENDHPTVGLSATREDAYWHITIEDDGIGIEERHQDRVFEPFKRLHTRESYPGTGIGLSIARRIVEAHGGNIWLESTLGLGTTVHIVLPAAGGGQPDPAGQAAGEQAPA